MTKSRLAGKFGLPLTTGISVNHNAISLKRYVLYFLRENASKFKEHNSHKRFFFPSQLSCIDPISYNLFTTALSCLTIFLSTPLIIPFLTLTYGSGRVSFEIKIVCGVTQLPILLERKPLPPPPLSLLG